ncbi:hypothetical protein T459_34664 [Capsicum annuum]|uniref:Uncharacterized protein n=1 Tax=Capsicum annuum TaxID=4072 RepID=A0A2G2XVJ6_CAPAN|nr:hypothetical protein T459_34664 [Capsicum annuum]
MEHGEEDTFVNLKYLGLNDETLAKWEFAEESFPVLEKLALWECRKLTKIPPNFGDIDSLKIIELFESPQLEDSAVEIKQYVEDITGVDKLQILDLNNIPLSKTVSFILSLSKSRTLPCFPKLLCHAQFTPSSWRAAAMPSSASLLQPNASDFNLRVSSPVSLSLKHTWCFPELLRDAQFTPLSWRAAAMPSSASFFTCKENDHCWLYDACKAVVRSSWGRIFSLEVLATKTIGDLDLEAWKVITGGCMMPAMTLVGSSWGKGFLGDLVLEAWKVITSGSMMPAKALVGSSWGGNLLA